MEKKIKLAIAEDHPVFREGLSIALEQYDDIEVCIKAANGKELIEKIKSNQPDVILMDLKMPEMDGIEATSHITCRYPEIKILVFTIYDELRFVIELIKSGASGFLNKSTEIHEIKAAIDRVIGNDYYFDKYMKKELVEAIRGGKSSKPVFDLPIHLNSREEEILKLICKEYKSTEIADKMKLSVRTIENYRNQLLEKTGAKNAAGLVMFAIANGFAEIDLIRNKPL